MSLWWRAGHLLILLLWIADVIFLLLPSWARALLDVLLLIMAFAFVLRWAAKSWPEELSKAELTRGLSEQKRRNDALEKKLADQQARLQKLEGGKRG